MFAKYRNQTGVTSRFGFTGEYYAQETGMWHLRARDLHPSLGRFLSADPVQPNAPGTQGYNRYAYVANNPTTWVDPSGYSVEPLAADLALLGMMYAMRSGLVGILYCALDEECRDMKALMRQLGSRGANLITWTAEELERALFSTYPHQPTPVDPGLLVLSMGLSNTPILGDLYDLYTGVTGYDPITGQYLAGWERLTNIVGGLILLPGVTGSNVRHGVHAVESLIDSGDELAQFIGQAARKSNSGFEDFGSLRFRVKYDKSLPAGEGFTDEIGNIFLSPRGTRTDRLQALYHEQVHAFILKNPLLRPLSQVGYSNSQLWRYTEEAVAEARAQLLTGGRLVNALSHPFHPHYRITATGMAIEAAGIGLLGYGAYWTWSQITSCDSSGNC